MQTTRTICSACGQVWAYGRPVPPFKHVDCLECPKPSAEVTRG